MEVRVLALTVIPHNLMDPKILASAAESLLTKKLLPTSAIIVAMFVLLYLVAGPLRNSPGEHNKIQDTSDSVLQQSVLTNHFLWANCMNEATSIIDVKERQDAIDRCLPPLTKQPHTDAQAYMFTEPYLRPIAIAKTSDTSSASSSSVQYNKPTALKNAEEQREDHLRAISGAVTTSL